MPKDRRRTWETRRLGVNPNAVGESISRRRSRRESAGFVVAGKRSNVRGAKEPHRAHVIARREDEPLEQELLHYG